MPRSVALVPVVLFAAIGAYAIRAGGQEPRTIPPADDAFADFRGLAARYVITAGDEPLALHPASLLNWGNPVRQQERGSMFLWLKDGRPQVAGSIFTYVAGAGEPRLKHELQSLSVSPLTARYEGILAWRPRTPGIVWRPPPARAPPSTDARRRLAQMRQISREFQVTLHTPEGDRTELRLMPQPLFRYASPPAGVLDGALFSFVVATDPEALLLVEAAGPPGRESWQYAFARFHFWRLEAQDASGRTVWSAEEDLSHATNPIGNSQTIEKTYNSFQP